MIWIVSVEQMKQAEQRAIDAGQTEAVLMDRAGGGAARAIATRWRAHGARGYVRGNAR